jgi:hypothetical protein
MHDNDNDKYDEMGLCESMQKCNDQVIKNE